MRKNPKTILFLRSSLNISGIGVKTHSHLIDMEKKDLVTADPNKNKTLAKKESTSSASEAPSSMVFNPDHNITDSAP